MKKLLLLHLLLAMFLGAQTVKASVVLNATNFPDATFRAYISNLTGVSVGSTISDATLARVESIDVTDIDISSLQGIEYFSNLTRLNCSGNQLTSLDLRLNPKLTLLVCSSNQLTSLDVRLNTNLTYLKCNNNQLTSLYVSNNTELVYLSCGWNQLTSLDVSKNTKLTELYCYNNQLTSLDVTKNTNLTKLYCDNNQLTSFDVSKNTELTELQCLINQLTSLDVSKNTELSYLNCASNRLTSLNVTKNTKLTKLYCYSNQLTSLDVSKNTELTYLYCSNNQLTSLDVTKNTKLTKLYCNSNQLTSLDVSKNTNLTDLSCGPNPISSIDVTKNTELGLLDCGASQLSSLDVTKNMQLKELYCGGNNISTLNLSNNTELETLNCTNCKINQLDLSNKTKLSYLKCNYNYLTYLNLDDNTALTNSDKVNVDSQESTRRFQIDNYNSNRHNCWTLFVNTTDASRIRALKIDGVSKTPKVTASGWLVVSEDLKKIPQKVEYEYNTGKVAAGWMSVTVNYDVKKYGVYVAGTELTSLNFYDIPGLKEGTAYFYDESYGIGWSGIYPTLVLENAKIEGEEGIRNEECYNLNIIVRGNNEVTATDYNAFSNNSAAVWTYFSGGGALHLTATGDRWYGIYSLDSYITIKDATKITAQGDGYGYFDDNSILYIQGNSILACYGNKYPSVELPKESQRKFDSNIDVRYPVGAYMDSGHHVYYAGTTTDVQRDWVVIGPDNQATQDFIIATGISLTEEGRSQMEDGAIYNLAGQKMVNDKWSNGKLPRGINIVGGKKIIKK